MSSYLGPYPNVSIEDEIADLERELRLREETVYPERVRRGKLERTTAARQIACCRATLARLRKLLPVQTALAL